MSAPEAAFAAPVAEITARVRQLALEPPLAFGRAPVTGVLRTYPEDFVVDEDLGFTADGDGPHWLLRVRKRGANTEYVARQLASHGRLPAHEIGFAGLKDRHAVTSQWFTVPRGKSEAQQWLELEHPEFEILEVHAHRRKLKRGALAGNRFDLKVREIRGDIGAALQRATQIAARGVPNYFGPQRFGRNLNNIAMAQRWADGMHSPRSRSDQSFGLSAARSLIFNATLAKRVEAGTWDALEPGDVANLDGSGSVFSVAEVDDVLRRRIGEFDIHPTVVLWGSGPSMAQGAVAASERETADEFASLARLLEQQGLRPERRSARMAVRDLVANEDPDGLRLSFRLPAGGFATTVMRELLDSRGGDERGGGDHD